MLTDRFSDTGYMTENGPCPAFKGESEIHGVLWSRFTDNVSRNWREARAVRSGHDTNMARGLPILGRILGVEGMTLLLRLT